MLFHAGGENKLFICSADWMSRNIDNRVEVSVPIYDLRLKQMIMDILSLQFNDNTKARVINKEQSNPYRNRGNKRKVRSQIAIYQYLINYEKRQLQEFNALRMSAHEGDAERESNVEPDITPELQAKAS